MTACLNAEDKTTYNREDVFIMKKKIFAFALMAVMAIGVLAGCGNGGANNQTTAAPTTAAPTDATTEAPTDALPKLTIGIDDTFAPMGFRDESGELVGFDVELAKAVCNIIGYEPVFQPIDWSMKETELNAGNIDLIWNGYTITDARKEQVLFTRPYLKNAQAVVVMEDSGIKTLADLKDKKVAAQAASSALEAIDSKPEIKDTFADLVTFETNNDCLMDLEAGRSDAVVADEILVRYVISQKDSGKFKVLFENFGDEEYGIGARKDAEELVTAINEALDTLKENGEGGKISEKWFFEDILL